MLSKAILTGGVLSVLAGAIVYFGTEGADALEKETRVDVRLEETELAGAAVPVSEAADTIIKTVGSKAAKSKAKKTVEAADKPMAKEVQIQDAAAEADTLSEQPPAETTETTETKPKTRWLDQYLKSGKKKASEVKSETSDVVVEKPTESITAETNTTESNTTELETVVVASEAEIEVESVLDPKLDTDETPPKAKRVRKKKLIVKIDGDKDMLLTSEVEGEADETIDMKMIEKILSEHTDLDVESLSGSNMEIRVIKLDDKKLNAISGPKMMTNSIEYDVVLAEAKKLQVIDMRNQALFEIVDYAIDHGDIGVAADVVDEFSSPELRDTARARIGVGLATGGDMGAAFAVLDEIEIDELSAPIRLEIIAALMATRAERAAVQ